MLYFSQKQVDLLFAFVDRDQSGTMSFNELLPHLFANRGVDDVLVVIEKIEELEEERRREAERAREEPGRGREGHNTPFENPGSCH